MVGDLRVDNTGRISTKERSAAYHPLRYPAVGEPCRALSGTLYDAALFK
jgi:hypothetical protein